MMISSARENCSRVAVTGRWSTSETYALAFKFAPRDPPGVRVTGLPSGGASLVTFVSPGGRSFQIEAKSNITNPVLPWTVVASGTTDASGTTTVSDPGAVGQAKRFYRVVLEVP